MVDLALQDRLQPALLDRLADDEPDNKKLEPREKRIVTKTKLRQSVLRDLAWLLNATNLGNHVNFEGLSYAESSVINYGMPVLSGHLVASLDFVQLENMIKRAIISFEPRITPESLQVKVLATDLQLNHHNQISIQISGDLWAQPIPIEMLLKTEIDLETGQVEIHDLAASSLSQVRR